MMTYDDVLEFDAGESADLFTAAGRRYSQGCAMLQALGTGTLDIKTVASDGAIRSLDVTDDEEIRVRGVSLESTTTVPVRVFWRVGE